jgi:6-phosphogluconate dehydrogenase
MSTQSTGFRLGMIGLGTMGRNLLLNMAEHGFPVAGYDKDMQKVSMLEAYPQFPVKGFSDIAGFASSLVRPRAIMMLVPAGKPVDAVIEELLPVLEQGDIIIDAGNSHFEDTEKRVAYCNEKGLHFFGMGVSGGEEGARQGPSMMPGGDKQAYEHVRDILEAIAARVDNEPCVAYMGHGSAGHFVKMVHNGIEYALMQLIAETYELLKKKLALSNGEIADIFQDWNRGRLQSFLVEITSSIFRFREAGSDADLIDKIKDEAKAKGTGKWTSQVAMDLQVPLPTIDAAVSMRDLSKFKSVRTAAATSYAIEKTNLSPTDPKHYIAQLEHAFYFSMANTYAQGMHLLQAASSYYKYDFDLASIARIWRGGCIIRAAFLNNIYKAYSSNPVPSHLLLDASVRESLSSSQQPARKLIADAIQSSIAIPAFASAITYFDSITSERLPANLIQAQRDFFGAHKFEKIGEEGEFHSQWSLS